MAFLTKSSNSKTNHAPANRSMVRLAALPLQAKLRMGRPNDAFEQEANRVADRVMGMSEAQVHRQTDEEEVQTQPLVSQITPLVQRQEEEEETTQTLQRQEEEKETAQTLQRQEEEEEETAQTLQRQEEEEETAQTLQRQPEEEEETTQTLQRQEEEEETAQAKTFPGQTPRISANLESRIQSQRGGGQPLPESTRNFFEPRVGTNFSGVRVHTDAEANSLSRKINARAFTVGRDIFVGSEQYNPYSSAGRHLLAHELTHVVQQEKKPNPETSPDIQRQTSRGSTHNNAAKKYTDFMGIFRGFAQAELSGLLRLTKTDIINVTWHLKGKHPYPELHGKAIKPLIKLYEKFTRSLPNFWTTIRPKPDKIENKKLQILRIIGQSYSFALEIIQKRLKNDKRVKKDSILRDKLRESYQKLISNLHKIIRLPQRVNIVLIAQPDINDIEIMRRAEAYAKVYYANRRSTIFIPT
ncbi:MAG: DUF4157 domain-containing protein [Xenococcus sp. (in: cyanobacteria)]